MKYSLIFPYTYRANSFRIARQLAGRLSPFLLRAAAIEASSAARIQSQFKSKARFVDMVQTHANPPTAAPKLVFVGVDVGGTYVKLGLVEGNGRILWNDKFETRASDGPLLAIQRTRRLLGSALTDLRFDWKNVGAIGLGTPGPIDIPKGLILNPGNLPQWHGAPIREMLSSACEGTLVTFTNDANAAAFGEFWIGAGRGAQSLFLLTLGTGVGGGLIVDGRCIEGKNSSAAEAGHISVEYGPEARLCPCGKRGHLEAYASATALISRTREALQSGVPSTLQAAVAEGQPLDGLLICRHAENGDSLARREVFATADYLARGIADLAHIIDPELFILGGAMNFGGFQARLGREFLERIEQDVRQLVFPVISARFKMVYSQLGSDAGWVGAAGLARQARAQSHST